MPQGYTITEKKRIQSKRLEYFPPDRIPFWSSETNAGVDIRLFKEYEEELSRPNLSKEDRERIVDKLRHKMEKNNYLPIITREQFIAEAHFLGYDPDNVEVPRYSW